MSAFDYKYILKYIVIGDMGVGKSCLLQHFLTQRFHHDNPHTIGVEFGSKIIETSKIKVKLQIWDTAGQERFRSVTRSYYRGAACALLVYDLTRRKTFINCVEWINDARQAVSKNCVIVLVGNKADLEQQREVSFEEAKRFADEYELLFMETSAKNGSGVEDAFVTVASKLVTKVENGVVETSVDNGIQLKAPMQIEETSPTPRQKCC